MTQYIQIHTHDIALLHVFSHAVKIEKKNLFQVMFALGG